VILGSGNSTRERYNKPLTGLLRSFPCTPAKNLTRIRLSYHDEMTRSWGQWGYAPSHGPNGDNTERFAKRQFRSQTFIDILRDAHILSQFFDKLRVFEVCWGVRSHDHSFPMVLIANNEEVVEAEGIVQWMRECTEKGYVVPWEGVRFKLEAMEWLGMKRQEGVLNEAYRVLMRESRGKRDIEDSGRVWLEEMGEEGGKRRRGHKKGKSSA
jgi:hypothetical protein